MWNEEGKVTTSSSAVTSDTDLLDKQQVEVHPVRIPAEGTFVADVPYPQSSWVVQGMVELRPVVGILSPSPDFLTGWEEIVKFIVKWTSWNVFNSIQFIFYDMYRKHILPHSSMKFLICETSEQRQPSRNIVDPIGCKCAPVILLTAEGLALLYLNFQQWFYWLYTVLISLDQSNDFLPEQIHTGKGSDGICCTQTDTNNHIAF